MLAHSQRFESYSERLQTYRLSGAIRLADEPSLSALDCTNLHLQPDDIVDGYEIKNHQGDYWLYLPFLDKFIWYGRKVHEWYTPLK
jgi:hypothetical protein